MLAIEIRRVLITFMSNIGNIGLVHVQICIFIFRLFKAFPQLLPKFSTLNGMDFEAMKQHYKLRAHAGSFKAGITSFIDSLDDIQCLQLLVKRHTIHHYEMGLRVEQFQVGVKRWTFLSSVLLLWTFIISWHCPDGCRIKITDISVLS